MGVNKGRKEVNKERKGVNKDINRGNMERKGVNKEDSLFLFSCLVVETPCEGSSCHSYLSSQLY